MSGHFYVDFTALAISLFNTVLLVWLGLTVLFNAERRTWGVFLAGDGLLIGAAFFFSHSVILSQGAAALVQAFSFWWHVGWAPVIAAPYAWYLLMLWYSGFWEDRQSALYRRQRPWLWSSVLYTLLLLGLLVFANPLPEFERLAAAESESTLSLSGIPLLALAYPPYILACIGLALDALLRPAPSGRVMGDAARRRARPWLVGASVLMLLVSLSVGAIFYWVVQNGRQHPFLSDLIFSLANPLSWLDLFLAALLMVAVLLMGQAIVSYEIFTGKILPRRGLRSRWRDAILMAAAFGVTASWGISSQTPSVYILLPLLALATLFYVLISRRSDTEREQGMNRMRPFIANQRLYEQILSTSPVVDLSAPFAALCRDVLGAKQAAMLPLGSLAALVDAPLLFPPTAPASLPLLADRMASFDSPQRIGLQLDPLNDGGYAWAAPLWSERGLTGLLLLGEKSDGGFYALEEIEMARASGERLADIQASAEMARRLVSLQRQRLAENQVIDRRTRRELHDEVLPRLHTALLQLSSYPALNTSNGRETLETLAGVHRQISNLLHDLPAATASEVASLGLLEALRRVTRTELADAFDEIAWQVHPEDERRVQELPALTAEVVYYAAREAMRNAARHAHPATSERFLALKISVDWCDGLEMKIEDNGVGITETGQGHGLALHSTMMAVINGSLALESLPGEYTRVVLRVKPGL